MEIIEQIKEWASSNIGSSFVFRPHQAETIASIIENVISKQSIPTHIIEAPTGSGKSLICMIAAGVLDKYYNKKSYILCSDLYLFSQYERFIRDNKLNFGYLKGQTGNYYCDKNGEDVRNGDCRIAKMSWSKLYDKAAAEQAGFPCASYCTYLFHRHNAQKANVTLMTYQLYFYMINVVRQNVQKPPFPARDVIFCDECHNIPSLIQSQYSPTVKESMHEKLVKLYRYNILIHQGLFAEDEETNLQNRWADEKAMVDEFYTYWNSFKNENTSDKENLSTINRYIDFFNVFNNTVELLEQELQVKRRSSPKMSKEGIKMYKLATWYRNYHCLISDFCSAVNDCGEEYIVKQQHINNDTQELSVSLSCAKEDYMCFKYLLNTAPNQVLTSATVGLREAYEDNIGIKYNIINTTKFDIIPSTFDFTNSPVIVSNRYKMSYDKKAESLPCIADMIYQIIRAYNGKRGMIQTGSYENAKYIVDNAPADIKRRLQLYNNSQEKSWMIEMHKAYEDSVIIGPTLVEGVDLPGDLLRFIIIAKVPYPNLKDKLVKAKMKLFPKWYSSETANSIIQGVGRGNRFADDWCITYIIDGCFDNLYYQTSSQFPVELRNRIRHV